MSLGRLGNQKNYGNLLHVKLLVGLFFLQIWFPF